MTIEKMQILRLMSGHILRDRIIIEDIGKGLVVISIEDKMKESCLRWYGHVQ